MQTKHSQLLDLMRAEKWHAAIKFASKFHDLGDEREAILSARQAINHPSFQMQIRRDPEQQIVDGIAALKARYPKFLQAPTQA